MIIYEGNNYFIIFINSNKLTIIQLFMKGIIILLFLLIVINLPLFNYFSIYSRTGFKKSIKYSVTVFLRSRGCNFS